MTQESASDLLFVDDFYSSLFFDDVADNIFPAKESASDLLFVDDFPSSLFFDDVADNIYPAMITTSQLATKEAGESSHSFCDICVERKDSDQMFRNERCVHSFCSDCITKHISIKIQDGITVVSCPGLECKGVLELDDCRLFLPKDVTERWDQVLCRALFASEMMFYCPFKDCSAMLVNDKEEGEVIRQSECPFCHRLFCAQCCVPWHPGIECEEFQRLNESEREREDLMLRELAREKKWRRCPDCKYYVERTEGCLHMTCRCTFQFCYGCGASWTKDHGGNCARD